MKNEKQKVIAPSYMKNFACIGAKCEDTCCAGWYIAIDENTYNKYKKVKDKTMQTRLKKEVVARKSGLTPEHVAKIKLKNGRCAFLTKEGWCDIYTNLGENYLSNTCTLYPRTINKINDTLEYSVTFSCPEASRVILLGEEPIRFEETTQDTSVRVISADLKINHTKPKKWQDYFLELRETAIFILQNRNYSLEKRLMVLGKFMADIDKVSGPNNLKKISSIAKEYRQASFDEKLAKYNPDFNKESKDAVRMIQYLKAFSQEHKLASPRYVECLDEVVKGLELDGQVDHQRAAICYKEGYEKNYQTFMKDREYILENYLVNYVFERCIPLDGNMPSESFMRLRLYYLLIKFHLVGIARANDGLDEEHIVKLIQAFGKIFDHNEQYFLGVMDVYYR